ncbi:MAG: 3'-5' exonuclease [Bdellovibrionales bacterium]|nr:3'-5' exonuclease [Bdellovibrionales bacterium]
MARFLAIDFETADYQADSACSIGLVLVENGKIIHEEVCLIRPPREKVMFTEIHGLTWDHVSSAPTFGELWPSISHLFEGIDFLAAHNASFDSRVLKACCTSHGFLPPSTPFVCTVQLARKTWKMYPTNLPAVCKALNIPLQHHEALSDARACAQIVVLAQGVSPSTF